MPTIFGLKLMIIEYSEFMPTPQTRNDLIKSNFFSRLTLKIFNLLLKKKHQL